MKILISDKSNPKCAEIIRGAGHVVDEKFGISPEDLKSIISEYDGLIVRSATKVTSEIIDAAKNLKVIGRAGAGVDNIDVKAATAKNIVVMNTPGANTNAVVELTITYLFALSRRLYTASHSLKEGRWEKKKLVGTELQGKTLGIIGYGKIGQQVAKKSVCLGMDVIYYDPYLSNKIKGQPGTRMVKSLDDVLEAADYISIHVPKSPETTNFIKREHFEKMKKGVYIINCARGGIVNEEDLIWAMEEGIVAGAGIDVYPVEPPEDLKLAQHPNVICSPHLGASSKEAQENVGTQIAAQFVDMFAGKGIRNAVKPKN